jgi:hypothetical protein
MRTMQIRPFAGLIEIKDIGVLIETRLRNPKIIRPDQAIALLGYMAWPSEKAARNLWLEAHQNAEDSDVTALLSGLKIRQQHWARVADIFHLVYDMHQGGYAFAPKPDTAADEDTSESPSASQIPVVLPLIDLSISQKNSAPRPELQTRLWAK